MLSPLKIMYVWTYVYVCVHTFLLVTHAGDGVEAAGSCVGSVAESWAAGCSDPEPESPVSW